MDPRAMLMVCLNVLVSLVKYNGQVSGSEKVWVGEEASWEEVKAELVKVAKEGNGWWICGYAGAAEQEGEDEWEYTWNERGKQEERAPLRDAHDWEVLRQRFVRVAPGRRREKVCWVNHSKFRQMCTMQNLVHKAEMQLPGDDPEDPYPLQPVDWMEHIDQFPQVVPEMWGNPEEAVHDIRAWQKRQEAKKAARETQETGEDDAENPVGAADEVGLDRSDERETIENLPAMYGFVNPSACNEWHKFLGGEFLDGSWGVYWGSQRNWYALSTQAGSQKL
ncbi:hypothetical protein BDY21DRAFT_379951 [Lineolata rhizophorae]|uniref:Uncharacterized protein n=1 Tax=Lineolata rhizophorae TaxID=578093 RepID=A0A6A6NXC2_9PEZI|nr:hypothetical protein BDY21DRAFT_379951 [Lineolata rhizophorae]